MKFQVNITPDLERSPKKYRSIYKDILRLIELLEEKPDHGTALSNNLYKVRLNITGLSKGKNGGARGSTNSETLTLLLSE
jgi:hypothetical protein